MLPTKTFRCQLDFYQAILAEGSKLQAGSSTPRVRAAGPGRWEQPFFNSMQAFPCGLGQRGVRANNVSDHLPGRQVERALRRRTHGQRNRALRAEAYPLRRRFLARPYSHRLCEQIDRDRFLPGLELPITAKAIQAIQEFCLQRDAMIFTILSPSRCRGRKYVEGFPPTRGPATDLRGELQPNLCGESATRTCHANHVCSRQKPIATRTLLPWASIDP
jgi:hypothetical protein